MEEKNNDLLANQLSKWYYSLPVNEFKDVRDKIILECEITRFIFYNWLSGKTRISKLNQKAIETVARKEIFTQN